MQWENVTEGCFDKGCCRVGDLEAVFIHLLRPYLGTASFEEWPGSF